MKLFPGKEPTSKPSMKFVNQCSVFISRNSKEAIIVSSYYFLGAYIEKDDGAIKIAFDHPDEIGPIIESKFFDCEYMDEDDYPPEWKNNKESDWPAYKASKAKSMKQFKRDYVRYSLRGANEANIIIAVNSQKLQNDIELTTAFSAPSCGTFAGQKMIDLHNFFLKVESLTD